MKYILFVIITMICHTGFTSNEIVVPTVNYGELYSIITIESDTNNRKELIKTKVIAVSLAITLGVFGVHRLYLGTKPIVPVAYTLTLGGMIILPIIDIIYIISAKDLNEIKNNNYVFMWNKK